MNVIAAANSATTARLSHGGGGAWTYAGISSCIRASHG